MRGRGAHARYQQDHGKERVGAEVAREKRRDELANAVKPITGLTPQQFETQGRRMKLAAEAQRDCRALDLQIARAESDEQRGADLAIDSIRRRLYALRRRYRDIGC